MNKETTNENINRRSQKDETKDVVRDTQEKDIDRDNTKTKDMKKVDDVKESKDVKKTASKKVAEAKPVIKDSMMSTLGLLGALALIFVLYFLFGSSKSDKDIQINEESTIKKFNNKRHEYSLKINSFFHKMSLHQVSEMFKATLGDHNKHPQCDSFDLQSVVIPSTYNFYDQHPNCKFNDVQQKTATGYVEVLTSTFRARYCALHLGKDFVPSTLQLLTCDINKNGVKSGKMSNLLDYVKKNGFVSESCFNSLKKQDSGCVTDSEMKKCEKIEMTKFCYLKQEKYIKREIFMNGPVISVMDLYPNFLLYEKGLYSFDKSKKMEGQVFVKIVGWGLDDKKKNEHWIVESSFGKHWGENGLAKVKMHMKGSSLDDTAIAIYPKIPEVKTETK